MVRDREALRAQVLKHLGANTRAERIGDAEMLVAVSPKREAASFIANYLVMGEETNVRRCLEARRTSRTLATIESFKQSVQHLATTEPIGVVTFTNDASSARAVISSLSTQSFLRTGSRNNAQLEQALTEQPYAVSETRFVVGGFERRTRSAFGQFGRLVVQFDAPEND